MLLTTLSPEALPFRSRAQKPILIFLSLAVAALFNSGLSWAAKAAQQSARPHHETAAAKESPRNTELHARQQKLDAAKQAGDPTAIRDASREVVASTLHAIGGLKLIEKSAPEAIEIYRRSIDFEDSPDTHIDLAAAYLAANRLGDSLTEVTNTILVAPENARAWHLHGKILMAKNDYSHAADALRKSLALQTNANASYLLGSSLLQLKEYEEAKAVFRDLAGAGKDRASLHLLLAEAYERVGLSAEADSELRQALRLDPSAQRERTRLAKVDPAAQFDPEIPAQPTPRQVQAAKAQEREVSRVLATALNDLGATEARQQKFDLALAHFHEAERWHADTPGLMRNIGMAAVRVSDYAEAVRALRHVVAANPGDQVARSLLGTALFSIGNFAEAAREFTPLGDSVLEEPELAYAWAISLVKTTRFSQATVLLDKLEKQRLPAETLVLIAQAWSQMGNYPRTVESCNKALQLDPKRAQVHFIAGMALIRSDRPAEAVSEFQSELELDPNNNDAQYHLAFALLQLSRGDEAVEVLRGVLTHDPNHAQANYELGRELLNEGKKEEAIRYLEAAARLNPQLDAVHYQLQSAYRAVGRREDADRELKIYREMKTKNRKVNVASPMGQSTRE